MRVRHLIDGCVRYDPEAWAQLWEIVSSAVLYPIRRLLQNHEIGLELADDVMQDFYLFLREKNLEHLRAFQSETMPQFRVYLRTLAIHFTLNSMRKMKRMQREEARALLDTPPPDRTGPTERQIESTMRELESLMPEKDRTKLAKILHMNSLDEARLSATRSSRTDRRWKRELYRRYGRRVI
jgi:hypothetical protein